MAWDLSCKDWERRLRDGRSLVPTLPLDVGEADRAVKVFNLLRLADVPGTPQLKDAGGDWFRDIVRALFGSVDPVTRERRVRELFLLIPKKNSKTTNGALLMLAALWLNERPKASFIMTAPVHDIAELAFAAAAGAIALDPVLSKVMHVREHVKTIVHRVSGATLQIMTFDPQVLTGQKVSGGVLIDELHVVARNAKAASAIRQLRGGMLPFPEAFMAFITTQSEEPPSGVFHAELSKARAIRDGSQEGAMLPVLYEFPPSMQRRADAWRDSKNWAMVNPNAGRSISVERLVGDMQTAQNTSDEELRAWASQHLNIEIGLALLAGGWAGGAYWEASGEPGVTLDSIINTCEVVCVGIDGGGLDDLFGMCVIGREAGSGERTALRWRVWCHAWAHPIALERNKAEAPKLLDFVNDGDLTLVETIGDDVRQAADIVERIYAAGLLDKVGVDPAGIGATVDELEARGIEGTSIVGISQGWKLVGAIKTVERKLAGGGMIHAGSRLMAYCVGNARAEPRGNAVVITKQNAGGKIDPLAATFNAVALMSLNPEPAAPQLFTV